MAEDLKARLAILINRNARMSRGKQAAHAAHAALEFYGIEHGAIVVLDASPTKIHEQCDLTIADAGRTELKPGTLTAGVRRDSSKGVQIPSGLGWV